MRILLTGASSFTGYWFAKALVDSGHAVTATFSGPEAGYSDVRAGRVSALAGSVDSLWSTRFGDDNFLAVVSSRPFDVLCLHGADVTNYKSWDFDALEATRRNTHNLRPVLSALAEGGCHKVIATGSVFEPHEGVGGGDTRGFNPYGLSKLLTFESTRLEADRAGMALGKFVIANPFGALEEPRFTSYLVKNWMAGKTPGVATPAYVRDNIPVTLLAQSYARFCGEALAPGEPSKLAPSGYIETQGAFALRVAREFSARTGLSCPLDLAHQTEFQEPVIRINANPVFTAFPQWSESGFWDAFTAYYRG